MGPPVCMCVCTVVLVTWAAALCAAVDVSLGASLWEPMQVPWECCGRTDENSVRR